MNWLRLEGANPVLHERYFSEIRVTEDLLVVECILMHNSSGLQCATVSCSVLQCLAVSCSVLQRIPTTEDGLGVECILIHMGWLWLVGSIKLQVYFAKEPYKREYILQKRPII